MPFSGIGNARLTTILLLVAASLLAACQALPRGNDNLAGKILSDSDALFGIAPAMPTPLEIHTLDEDQQTNFLQYFHDPARAAVPEYQRVADYVYIQIRNFGYQTDTFTASDTLQSNSGNCLSLAIVTTAFAQLAGVETAYQLMDAEPVFEFHGTTVEKGVHVRTLLLNPNRVESPLNFSEEHGIRIDFFPTYRERFVRNMLNEEYVAMYFRNIANEALRRNDLHTAYWYARESLHYHPHSADALNTMAIVTRRAGHPLVAESIYLYAIEYASEKLTLLKNFRLLLATSGRHEEAELIDQRLRRMEDPSPFNWFQLARSSFEDGDYERAIGYYRRALTLAPYLHEAHLGIAHSYAELGYRDESVQSLVAAIDNAGRLRDRKYYKAKLGALQD
ncbi:MAG: tetratricopeptide repeat protein [Pseudohongiella sp.]|nr:tetratricopeptide repeat protein [Pseudohongiella sp.]